PKTCHYEYDRQGNTLSDGENTSCYDSLNRIVEVRTKNGDIQKNHYDGEGLRAELEENGRLVAFIFDGDKVVSEKTDNNTIRYIRGYELISSDSAAAKTYYHYASDELGSTTHLTDENGNVYNYYEYDAFGNFLTKAENVPNRFCFTGEQYDPLTSQYYLRARFYNPAIGRSLNEDTYYGDGLNLYAYCHNNPAKYVDPTGHWCEEKQRETEQKYRDKGYSDKDAEIMANYERLREEQGVSAAEKYLQEQAKSSKSGSKADVLAQNRANGRAFEQQEFAKFGSQNNNAVEQITVKTSSGVKTRVDAIGLDANGNVVINEYKSSLTAPLTDNQKIAYPEIFDSGATVV
ncbi:MAG: RHS repeat-associated core domain-containing protein, partial [Lachnospiraceae bacterium]|nr:RHS repeat-associated core domain-containing protein [Lachnospiraceae bacterium]